MSHLSFAFQSCCFSTAMFTCQRIPYAPTGAFRISKVMVHDPLQLESTMYRSLWNQHRHGKPMVKPRNTTMLPSRWLQHDPRGDVKNWDLWSAVKHDHPKACACLFFIILCLWYVMIIYVQLCRFLQKYIFIYLPNSFFWFIKFDWVHQLDPFACPPTDKQAKATGGEW